MDEIRDSIVKQRLEHYTKIMGLSKSDISRYEYFAVNSISKLFSPDKFNEIINCGKKKGNSIYLLKFYKSGIHYAGILACNSEILSEFTRRSLMETKSSFKIQGKVFRTDNENAWIFADQFYIYGNTIYTEIAELDVTEAWRQYINLIELSKPRECGVVRQLCKTIELISKIEDMELED